MKVTEKRRGIVMKKVRALSIILLFQILISLSGCTFDQNDKFIQGKWYFANELGIERAGPVHMLDEWIFNNGKFFHRNEVVFHNPNTLSGRYRIIESREMYIELELYDLQGNLRYSNTVPAAIQIDEENNEIRVNGTLYYRVDYLP
jgi:hypothetical protein